MMTVLETTTRYNVSMFLKQQIKIDLTLRLHSICWKMRQVFEEEKAKMSEFESRLRSPLGPILCNF